MGLKKHGVTRRNGRARNAQMPVNEAGIPLLPRHWAGMPHPPQSYEGSGDYPYPVVEQAGMPTHLAQSSRDHPSPLGRHTRPRSPHHPLPLLLPVVADEAPCWWPLVVVVWVGMGWLVVTWRPQRREGDLDAAVLP